MCEQGCQSNTYHSHHLWKGGLRLPEALIKINESYSRGLVRGVHFVICCLKRGKTKSPQSSGVFTLTSKSNPPVTGTEEPSPGAQQASR